MDGVTGTIECTCVFKIRITVVATATAQSIIVAMATAQSILSVRCELPVHRLVLLVSTSTVRRCS